MGTILESTKELAKRFGVETEEQTIKDQLDAITESIDQNFNGSVDIASAVSEFAKNDNPDARLGTKSITENGTYTALDDELDGYSSVTVNVEQASFTSVLTCIPEISTNQNIDARWYKLINNDSSTINITEEAVSEDVSTEYYTVLNPLKKGTCSFDHAFGVVTFTPAEDFDGLYNSRGNKYTFTGDEVTAGDGYCYVAKITEYNSTYVMKKTNNIFVNVINS